MQPPERGSDGTKRPETFTDDAWNKLRVASKNGFSLLLVGLSWWRKAISAADGADSELLTDWQAVVDDIAWVVKHWDSCSAKRKQMQPEAPEDDARNVPVRRSKRQR